MSQNIDSAAIETAKIADNAVTTVKLSNNSVLNTKISWSTTTDSNGWTKMPLSSNKTLYRKTFTFSNINVPGQIGFGTTAVYINLPVGVSGSESYVLAESYYCPSAEVTFQRLDPLSSSTRRLYAVNLQAASKTVSGQYTLVLLV